MNECKNNVDKSIIEAITIEIKVVGKQVNTRDVRLITNVILRILRELKSNNLYREEVCLTMLYLTSILL